MHSGKCNPTHAYHQRRSITTRNIACPEKRKTSKCNLTREEYKPLIQIGNNKNVVMLTADMGNTTVINVRKITTEKTLCEDPKELYGKQKHQKRLG